jgi:hypothetical protein
MFMFVELLVTGGIRDVIVSWVIVTFDFCFLIAKFREFYVVLHDIPGQAVTQLVEALRYKK